MDYSLAKIVPPFSVLLSAVAGLLSGSMALADVTVTGNVTPGATSWAGTPIAASVTNPSGQTSVAEGFGAGATSYAETFTVPITSSYLLDRVCLYVGGGTGTSGSAPLTINLYDLGGQLAPNPSGYLATTNLLGGGSGLPITYATQSNGVLQLDFTGSDRVTLVAGRLYAFELAGAAGTNPINWLRGITDTYSGGAAYRGRAWINGSNARDFALAVYGTATATPPTSSTINATVTHQVIDGFGAGTAFLDVGITQLTDAQMDALYGTGPNQMGLTLIRVRISPNGSSDWGDPMANGQKAHARGAKILATPWTPPASMKSNGSTIHGSLLPAQYQAFVDYLNSFTDAMATAGAPVDVVSLQNEPDFDPTYEGCQWTAAQFQTFCRDFAGGIKVPVMMPESYGYTQAVSDATLSDPLAAAHVAYVGGHLYGATIRDYPLARAVGKHTWMTEYLENNQTIASAVATAQQVQDCLTVGNMSGYIWWKTIGDANGLLNASGTLQPRAFVMGQFSRFIRPGDVRVDVPANDSSLGISAFKNPVTGTFTIVAVNNTGAAINHTFNLQGLTATTVTSWVTSATESLAVHAPITVSNGAFAYAFPAATVVTFVGVSTTSPVIVTAPQSQAVAAGAPLSLTTAAGGVPAPTFQWQFDGANLAGATAATLAVANVQPANAGLYTMFVTNATGNATSDPAIVGVSTTSEVIGAGAVLQPTHIVHPNGNIFDQVLLTGAAETLTALPGQAARTSYIDLNNDIVQVEFSGAGTLSLVLDDSSGPALPVNYNQSQTYMKGHAGIVIAGADDTTNVSVFTVGRATAFDPTGAYNILLPVSATNNPANNGSPLFAGHASTAYDGVADIGFIAITSANGKFGGVRAANASCFAAQGYTGIYAPGVQFTGPVFIGDINASAAATPVFIIGSSPDTRVTGGDLLQANGQPVKVGGLTQLKFTDGSTSGGALLPAQPIQGRLTQNGVDVTSQLATTSATTAKKFHPGHYMMLNIGSSPAQQRSLIAQNATDPNIAGFQICYTWAQLETGPGNYGGIDSTIASDLAYVSQFGKQLVVQLQYKSKALGDFPVDLQGAAGAFVQGPDGYYVPNFWDPAAGVLGRYLTLLQQIAAKCDAHPSLEIVNLAESATVDAATTLGGTYTAPGWVSALQTIAQTAAGAFKTTTFEEYINHISGDDSLVGTACANTIKAGCTFGGPDIDPSRNNIPAYDYYAQYAATAHLGSAVQPMDYGLTGAFWFDSDHSQTTEHLFGFATSSRLHVSYIYWLNNNSDLNWRNAKATIAAHPWPWF